MTDETRRERRIRTFWLCAMGAIYALSVVMGIAAAFGWSVWPETVIGGTR